MPTLGNLVAAAYHTLLKIIVHLQSETALNPDSLRPHYQNLAHRQTSVLN